MNRIIDATFLKLLQSPNVSCLVYVTILKNRILWNFITESKEINWCRLNIVILSYKTYLTPVQYLSNFAVQHLFANKIRHKFIYPHHYNSNVVLIPLFKTHWHECFCLYKLRLYTSYIAIFFFAKIAVKTQTHGKGYNILAIFSKINKMHRSRVVFDTFLTPCWSETRIGKFRIFWFSFEKRFFCAVLCALGSKLAKNYNTTPKIFSHNISIWVSKTQSLMLIL
jgi:hypothetical protein